MSPLLMYLTRPAALRMSRTSRGAVAAMALAVLAGCAAKEDVLPGERYDLRDLDSAAEQLAADQDPFEEILEQRPETKAPTPPYSVEGDPQKISLGTARTVSAWPQRYLSAERLVPHLQLADRPLTQVWATEFGPGNDLRRRMVAAPVAAGGRLFVLDALMGVSAIGSNGTILWQRNLTPSTETPGEVSGGGPGGRGGARLRHDRLWASARARWRIGQGNLVQPLRRVDHRCAVG